MKTHLVNDSMELEFTDNPREWYSYEGKYSACAGISVSDNPNEAMQFLITKEDARKLAAALLQWVNQ